MSGSAGDTTTPTIDLVKPEVGVSRNTWGTKTNQNWDKIDAAIAADRASIDSAEALIAALDARIDALELEAARASFIGEIRMWSGSIAAIAGLPGGVWKLCDGTAGTVNLVDRFVLGAGTGVAPGATGGAKTDSANTTPAGDHNHGGTQGHVLTVSQMPSHSHGGKTGWQGDHQHGVGFPRANSGANQAGGAGNPIGPESGATDWAGAHSHTIGAEGGGQQHNHTISGSGNHLHSVTIDTVPPFYALCFIQRVA